MTGKQVAKTENKSVIPAGLMDAFIQDSGAGLENVSSNDLTIPFIRLAQSNSPELKKSQDKFIDGCSQGDVFNTVTRNVWSGEEGVRVIPCHYVKKYLEFIPLDQGGGFRGELAANDPNVLNATRTGNKEILPNGNELSVSAQHYVLIQDPGSGEWQTAIVDMKSTNLKISRQWNTMMSMQTITNGDKSFKVPSFGCIWHLGVTESSNDMGSWYAWKVLNMDGYVEDAALYAKARDFSRMVSEGEVKAAQDPDFQEEEAASDDVPF